MTKNEIDLSDSIDCIWANKWKIVLITFVTLTISLFIKLNSKIPQTSFTAKTEIIPISTFDDYEYSAFNTFINNQNRGLNSYSLKNFSNSDVTLTLNFPNNIIPENRYLVQIDKKYLYDLFIEKIEQKELFVEGIRKFKLLKKEDYLNEKDYEAAIIKLASTIKISNSKKDGESQFIEFQTDNKKTWEELLYFVEESANSEIRDYLKDNFKLFISSVERLNNFSIEDIELEIINNLDDDLIVSKLKKIKKSKEENKVIERLVNLFNSTPIMMMEDFIASKINIKLTKYKKIQNNSYSTKKVIIASIILGVLLGTMYVLISNKLIKRKKKRYS